MWNSCNLCFSSLFHTPFNSIEVVYDRGRSEPSKTLLKILSPPYYCPSKGWLQNNCRTNSTHFAKAGKYFQNWSMQWLMCVCRSEKLEFVSSKLVNAMTDVCLPVWKGGMLMLEGSHLDSSSYCFLSILSPQPWMLNLNSLSSTLLLVSISVCTHSRLHFLGVTSTEYADCWPHLCKTLEKTLHNQFTHLKDQIRENIHELEV